jgi:chemotaxis protein histidine kinase CheA
MAGGGELTKTVAETEQHGIRLMLVRAHGCRICVALDAVEGIFDRDPDGRAPAVSSTTGATVPVVDWADVTGVGADSCDDEQPQVMVLRTPNGPVGLRIDACLGVRTVSLARTPPMPTRLRDTSGSPLCFLLMLDGRPHLMLEPRGLVARLAPEVHTHDGAGREGVEATP